MYIPAPALFRCSRLIILLFQLLSRSSVCGAFLRALKRIEFLIFSVFVSTFVAYCSFPWFLPYSHTFQEHVMDSVIEQLVANMAIYVRGIFLTPVERKYILSNLKRSHCETDSSTPATAAQAESNEDCNIASALCGDGEFHLSNNSYFGFSSLDRSVSGFWPIIWDSLRITWASKMHHHFVDWPYRAVSRWARLLYRKGKGPARTYVNTEGYPHHVALILIKDTLKR